MATSISTEITAYKNALISIWKELRNISTTKVSNYNTQSIKTITDSVSTLPYKKIPYLDNRVNTNANTAQAAIKLPTITNKMRVEYGYVGPHAGSTTSAWIWGGNAKNANNTNQPWIGTQVATGTTNFAISAGGTSATTINLKGTDLDIDTSVDFTNGKIVCNGTSYTGTYGNGWTSCTCAYLYAWGGGHTDYAARYPGLCGIKYFRIFTGNTLNYNFIPVVLTSGIPASMDSQGIARSPGVAGMWELVNNKFYTSCPNPGTTNPYMCQMHEYYTEHVYLQANSNPSTPATRPFIDTGVPITANTRIDCTFSPTVIDNYTHTVFGNSSTSTKDYNSNKFLLCIQASDEGSTYNNGFKWYGAGTLLGKAIPYNIYRIVCSKNAVSCMNLSTKTLIYSGALTDSFAANTITLFGTITNGSSANYNFRGRIYACKIYDGNTLVRDLKPCVLSKNIPAALDSNNTARNAGSIGMWDVVTNKFYANSGSANFTVAFGRDTFEPIEYITNSSVSSSSAAYIDTNVVVSATSHIYLDAQLGKAGSTTSVGQIGCFTNTSTLGATDFYSASTTSLNAIYAAPYTSNQVSISAAQLSRCTVDWNYATKKIVMNSTSQNMANTPGGYAPGTFFLGARNDATTTGGKTLACGGTDLIYRFRAWNNSYTTRVRDMIPVRLNFAVTGSSLGGGTPATAAVAGSYGMWDLVENKFYGNVGTSGSTITGA